MGDTAAINHLKAHVINGVHGAKSGHPGGALSSMDFAYILFKEFLRFDPDDSHWQGRDRFVLSAGHESMLLYSLLKGIGWLKEEDLAAFRQLGSKTPGHPENHMTSGVECTTGPLGQGAAMSVGLALGSSHLEARFESDLFSSRTYALLGDGCMQEEVTLGAACLAGHLGLSKLIWYYDKNNQQISGPISRSISCDFRKVFEGFCWDVLEIDGHSHDDLRSALKTAQKPRQKPLLIIGESIMAKGAATLEGSCKTHGAPFPEEERLATLKLLGVDHREAFSWPSEAKESFEAQFPQKREEARVWRDLLQKSLDQDPKFKKLYASCFESSPLDLLPEPMKWSPETKVATRNVFGDLIEHWSTSLPQLIGGSADLEPSNMTGGFAKKVSDYSKDNPKGRNLAFGVREFTMASVCNGLALHGGLIPFDATFLSFADYSRPALRLGAIQKVRVIHEFTHDSFYLGEDGPTHQPIEHLMSLRNIPDFYVLRPADARETEVLLRKALCLNAPSAICLSRQKLPILDVSEERMIQAERGAWCVYGGETSSDFIFFASGAEVHLALEVAKALEKEKKLLGRIKVISLGSFELFEEQEKSYREKILEFSCSKRISIEAGSTLGWERYVGYDGLKVGIDHFGASAPAEALAEAFGFTKEAILTKISKHFEN